jgi:hypothetical protein
LDRGAFFFSESFSRGYLFIAGILGCPVCTKNKNAHLCTPKRGVSFLLGIDLRGDLRLQGEGFIKFILTNFLLWSERVLPLQPCSEGMGKN